MCLCLGGSEKGCWVLGLEPGRGTHSGLFSQIAFQFGPASAPVVFPSSWAAGSCHCGAPVPAPEDALWVPWLQFLCSM